MDTVDGWNAVLSGPFGGQPVGVKMVEKIQKQVDKHNMNGVLEFLTLARPRVQSAALLNAHNLLRKITLFRPCYLRRLACDTALLGLRAAGSKDENEDMFRAFLIRGYELLRQQRP